MKEKITHSMDISKKSLKSWLIASMFLFAFSTNSFGQSKGPWKGSTITFKKSDYATWSNSSAQDRITNDVWITRKNDQGIFNIKTSGGYNGTEPAGTKWAFGTTASLSSLYFNNWVTTVGNNPPGMVNKDMVVLLVKDSIYIDIKFTSWTQGGAGGGFTYERTTDCRTFNSITAAQCDSFISPSKKFVWRKSGTYVDTLVNSQGCDSLLTVKLTVYGQDTTFKFLSGCGSITMPISKRVITTNGTYYDTLKKATICGRDSFFQAKVTIYPVPKKSMTVTACDSFVSPSGKNVWKTSGVFTEYLKATVNCDTLLTVNLTIIPKIFTKINRTACDSFISATNKIYRASGNYFDTLRSAKGCDSIIDLNLTINKKTFTKTYRDGCKVSFVSPSGRHIWGASGVYMDTLATKTGCDSILEVNLTLDPWKSSQNISSCDPYKSPSGKMVYTQTGIYYDTLQAKDLCDSLITINYKKLESTTFSKTISAAINRYHSPSGKYLWTQSGIYTDTIPNKAGCDSIITFDITVTNFSLDITQNNNELTAVADGVKYQWLNCQNNYSKVFGEVSKTFVVTSKGRYAVELSNQWNKDTSECVLMTLSVDNLKNLYGIEVYPNPNNGRFTLDLGQVYSEINNIQVVNALGEVIHEQTPNSKLIELNLTNEASAGLYFVRFIGNNFVYNASIVIQ